MKRHRYRQEALGDVPGAEAREYSPRQQELAPPNQVQLPLDGKALGPLFNDHHAEETDR